MPHADILLIEDDDVLCDLVKRNLQARGYVVHTASDAEHALLSLRRQPYDLVILDINLPDHTGWDVLRYAQQEGIMSLRNLDDQQQVLPVVVLSAVRVNIRHLSEFRPLAYLPKPFPMDALLRIAAETAARKLEHTVADQ